MNPTLIYCYDAYCGWCYGFSSVMQQINLEYGKYIAIEVLSGGMIVPEQPVHISAMASFIQNAYQQVENTAQVKFGSDFLWHVFNPDDSDWFPDSTKPAIALCIVKELFADKQVAFAADLQYALNFEGRDLTDDAAYLHLIEKYELDEALFFEKLKSDTYLQKALYEFQLCKQLKVSGFPAVFLQTSEQKFYLVASGYTPLADLKKRINSILLAQASQN